MWALMAMGLTLVFGVMNIPNFAHGEFFMIGTLVAYYVFTPLQQTALARAWTGLGPLLAIGAATLAGAVAGLVIDRTIFLHLRKRSRDQWIMNSFLITIGLSVFLINTHQLIFGVDFKGIMHYWNAPAVPIFGVYLSWERIVAFVLGIITITVFWVFMKLARLGRAIRAVSQDEAGALMVGININTINALTLALSCGLAALAGGSLLFMFPSFPTVGLGPLYVSWFVIIVVGLGNVGGAMFGGFIIALLQVLTVTYVGEGWNFIIPSLLMVIILIVKPSGLFGSTVRGVHDR
jgi:branched-chain amino acid transport system permease protein